MFYHASPTHCIEVLEPRVSNHDRPLVYLSKKRENVLPYLSNAVEKYCKETGFAHEGPWQKWGSYGFFEGKLQMDEYWPGALEDTYKDVSGYIYAAQAVPGMEELADIPDAVITSQPVELSDKMLAWIDSCIKREYETSADLPTYRHFLKGKFPEITAGLE